MISLEAMREVVLDIEFQVHHLEDCLEEAHDDNGHNEDNAMENHDWIDVDYRIKTQQYRVKELQRTSRNCEKTLMDDRDLLILYC